jgi:hypothetical protein
VSPLPPGVPAKRADLGKTISAVVSSCAGVGGAASICAAHSSTRVALLVFASMQVWPLCELICRWRMKWHYMRMYENVVNKAVDHPDDANLRTLLADLASTHLDDLGERIPIRGDLKNLEHRVLEHRVLEHGAEQADGRGAVGQHAVVDRPPGPPGKAHLNTRPPVGSFTV